MEFVKDNFGGVVIERTAVDVFAEDTKFENSLSDLLDILMGEEVRGVWITIPIGKSTFVPIAVRQGFVYHHTTPDSVTLNKWLPEEEKNTLPPYAQSFVGVGGVCINSEGQILCVQERYRYVKSDLPRWKIPTGMYDVNLDYGIGSAIEREIKEETGVDVEFQSILGMFFQYPDMHWGERTNLFVICRCRPITTELHPDGKEILDAKWIDFEKFSESGRMAGALYSLYNSGDGCSDFREVPPEKVGVPEALISRYKHFTVFAGVQFK